MTVPVRSGEITDFTPASWANLPGDYVFKFRSSVFSDRTELAASLTRNKLRRSSFDEIQDEVVAGLHANWPEDEAVAGETLLRSYWQEESPLSAKDKSAARSLERAIIRCHEPVSEMQAENQTFEEFWPYVALGQMIVGWEGFETPFQRSGGSVPLATCYALVKEMTKIETDNEDVEGVSPNLGGLQLLGHVAVIMGLTEEERKNSSSPSPTETTQDSSELTASQTVGSPITEEKPPQKDGSPTPKASS